MDQSGVSKKICSHWVSWTLKCGSKLEISIKIIWLEIKGSLPHVCIVATLLHTLFEICSKYKIYNWNLNYWTLIIYCYYRCKPIHSIKRQHFIWSISKIGETNVNSFLLRLTNTVSYLMSNLFCIRFTFKGAILCFTPKHESQLNLKELTSMLNLFNDVKRLF